MLENDQIGITDQGIALIKEFEGFRGTAYFDAAGIPTIGWGHTRSVDKKDVEQGLTITEREAEKFFEEDIQKAINAVSFLVIVKLSSGQRDALISFVYNIGPMAFENSTMLRRLNDGEFEEAASEFGRWIYGGDKVLGGLVKRRKREEKLFRDGINV